MDKNKAGANKPGRRLMALILMFAILLPTLYSFGSLPLQVHADSAEADVTSTVIDGGFAYITNKNLSYYGNRTYKLSLTATTSIREAHAAESRHSSNDGYFTVPAGAAGYYLLELWGGDGGFGADGMTGEGGVGGDGGYAYGYIWLNDGDTLVWTIGTNGDTAAKSGVGGENDSDGIYGVGGGGGYSAIYLIPANGDGSSAYEAPSNGVISDEDRTSKYIMIAGGGGGGGAGNSTYAQSGTADGGAGGAAVFGSGIELSESDNAANGGVAGTYYSGQNGLSSGTDFSYVGIGGRHVPGSAVSTLGGEYSSNAGQTWADGGVGGEGNLRGGSGGSGFAGGSGGVMEALTVPANIGGGGGGSTFVAKSVTVFELSENYDSKAAQSLLLGRDGNDNAAGEGGQAIVTYLGADPETKAYTGHLENVTITGEISEYFEILSVSVDNGEYTDKVQISDGYKTTNKVEITGADISPDEMGYEDANNLCRVDIILKAKSDFFGGNMVPILAADGNFKLTTADVSYSTPEGQDDKTFGDTYYFGSGKAAADGSDTTPADKYDSSADYCNVSLNMTASANSYSFSLSNIPDPFKTPADLYNDEYTEYRSSMGQFAVSFLESIGSYQVTAQGSTQVLSSLTKPTAAGTWKYTVYFTVSPKVKAANAAKVGPVIEDNVVISDTAVILVLEQGSIAVGDEGAVLSVDKLLNYDSATGMYHLSVTLSPDSNSDTAAWYDVYRFNDNRTADSTVEGTSQIIRYGTHNGAQNDLTGAPAGNYYTVPVTGWYAIGARGGRGGDSGKSNNAGYVGYGSYGATVTGYVWLTKGQTLMWYIGTDGANGASNQYNGNGGTAGQCTWIAVDGNPLIIAAGGSGGGGSSKNSNGTSVNDPWWDRNYQGSIGSSYSGNPSNYNGVSGTNGTGSWLQNGSTGTAGSIVNSYRNTVVKTSLTAADTNGRTMSNLSSEPYFADRVDDNKDGGVLISIVYAADEDVLVGVQWDSTSGAAENGAVGNGVTLRTQRDAAGNFVGGVDLEHAYVDGQWVNNLWGHWGQHSDGSWGWVLRKGLVYGSGSLNGYFDNLSLNLDFDKYFTLASIGYASTPADVYDVTLNNNEGGYKKSETVTASADVNSGNSGTITANGQTFGNYTLSQNANGGTSVTLTNLNYDGSAYAYVEYTSNQVAEGDPLNNNWDISWNHRVLFKSEFSITLDFYLKPAEGFIGGNDVPLLLLGGSTDDKNVAYAGIGITIPHDGATRFVETKNETDYTNVAINFDWDTEDFVTKQNIKLVCGSEIHRTDLIEQDENGNYRDVIDLPTGADAWKAAFVEAVIARENPDNKLADGEVLYETTPYTLTQKIVPKYEDGKIIDGAAYTQKALVAAPAKALVNDNDVTVTVVRPVQEKLENVTVSYDTSSNGVEAVPDDGSEGTETVYVATEADLSGTIIPDQGYAMPDTITVTACGYDVSGVAYDSGTGRFTIPASAVLNAVKDEAEHADGSTEHNIEITAKAEPETFALKFVWVDENDQQHEEFVGITDENSSSFTAGYTLTGNEWFEEFAAWTPAVSDEHKQFVWVWGTSDGAPLTEMPGHNTTVYGYITYKVYTVTVKYVYEEGGEAAPSAELTGNNTETYSLVSPLISGYVADKTIVSGTFEGDIEITVTYSKASGKLYIYYFYADSGEQAAATYTDDIAESGSYSVTSPDVEHYDPFFKNGESKGADAATVSGTVSAEDAENGIVIYVYYYPEQYTVKFELNDGGDAAFRPNEKSEGRLAEYDNVFGYDASAGAIVALPSPERKGYTFVGWFTEAKAGTRVTETTKVTSPAEGDAITLYAHWSDDIVSFEIEWTAIDFEFSDFEWDATSHTYNAALNTIDSEQGYFSVKNVGTIDIDVTYAYTATVNAEDPELDWTGVDGTVYDKAAGANEINAVADRIPTVKDTIEVGAQADKQLVLSGTKSFDTIPENGTQYVAGTLIITVGRASTEQGGD